LLARHDRLERLGEVPVMAVEIVGLVAPVPVEGVQASIPSSSSPLIRASRRSVNWKTRVKYSSAATSSA
jgi:hypothetical protein